MASEDHKRLAQYIKDVHIRLRNSTRDLGADTAWRLHCENEYTLIKYAECMKKLATTHWENNCNKESSLATSRNKWVADFCYEYFVNNGFLKSSDQEKLIAEKIGREIGTKELFTVPLKLLDVGSCYNPFQLYNIFDVFAIDLCPANDSVLKCDFLNVNISTENMVEASTVMQLGESGFDIVTFCFLLEYMPSSDFRVTSCERAYKLLKPGGLLIIITPDSKHVGANTKIMKCWRYTLALIGFRRIKYEKSRYMHCMVFRKSLEKEVAVRWATLYEESYMQYAIQIPQDFNNYCKMDSSTYIDTDNVAVDFQELPYFSNEEAE